ncbi:MAG TPA: HesA/MoeB/ThiF family protein [Kiritimatiellia bacterium]|nr:HesA/MoeB/ThiF family protein [Kiritimatiellia bacterium]HRZ12777.1 HesA/MoeB/ThiF family protein [Kiritimatiellia bacterium]HSA18271.1 HesA/MoeB/ThiF family protein [Kiritimatiellia bacterium]
MSLAPGQQQRYARHLALPQIGEAGQRKLLAGRVLVIGLGGLGSPAALYLAAAGVGCLGLADPDVVEWSNLQRQILHFTPDLGRPKTESAADKIRALNPDVRLRLHAGRFDRAHAAAMLREYDFVVDATDHFATKYFIAEACHAAGRAYAHAGIAAFAGEVMTVLPGHTACYRCLFDGPPPPDPASPLGLLGAVPGVIGCIQAAEAVKYLLGAGELLVNRLLEFDALAMTFREIPVSRNPACPLCGRPDSRD